MVYFELRYTPCQADNGEQTVNDIIDWLDELNESHQTELLPDLRKPNKWLIARESKNKYGEETSLHYHINVELPSSYLAIKPYKKDNMAKTLNRRFGLKGNKMYCLRLHQCLDSNWERWWRYCCKQGLPYDSSAQWEKQELLEMTKIANAEYIQRTKENNETRDKLVAKNNFRQKLAKFLKTKFCNDLQVEHNYRIDDKYLWITIAKYYQDNHTTPPFQKMDDLVIDMKVEMKWITLEEYYDIKH